MPDQKITQYTEKTAPVGTDLLEIVDMAATPTCKKATLTNIAPAVVGALASASNELGANVDIPTAGTFVDGPSVSIGVAATTTKWLVVGKVQVKGSTTNELIRATAKLWDGTTIWAGGESVCPAIASLTGETDIPLAAIITLSGVVTVKISATGSVNGQDILADNNNVSTGNHSSFIHAHRIA